MISHAINFADVGSIISQAQHQIDVNADFDLDVSVRNGVIHTYAKNTSAAVKKCIECDRYHDLIVRREKETFPNVAK